LADRATSQVAFGLQFVIPNMDSGALTADTVAIEAIASTVAQVLSGVVSVSNFTVVSEAATRRRLSSGAQVRMSIVAIPSTSSIGDSTDNEANQIADSFVDEFAAIVDSNVFATTLISMARSLGATAITHSSIDGIDSASVQLDTAVGIEFIVTAVPTAAPTADPSTSSTASTGSSSTGSSNTIIIVVIAVSLVILVGGIISSYYFFSAPSTQRGNRRSSKVVALHSIPQHVGYSEQQVNVNKDVEKGYIVTADQPATTDL
jgi:cytochrome bd-type quinol oxidase subunit 2